MADSYENKIPLLQSQKRYQNVGVEPDSERVASEKIALFVLPLIRFSVEEIRDITKEHSPWSN